MSNKDSDSRSIVNRRHFLRTTAFLGAGGLIASQTSVTLAAETLTLPFANGERRLVKFPQKRPLILLTTRPPQLETPFSVFNEGIFTPNDAFFVRYHHAQIPISIDPATFSLEIKGKVSSQLTLSLADLKTKFEPVEVVAVNQCSGNSRGFSSPRVSGGQMSNGAMGNARWKGVRLKDVLEKAGLATGAKQVAFNGLDSPVNEKSPDFVKALDVDHALDGEVMLAYEMNGEDLPMLNGYPLRLVVPGYYGTYWIKHVNEITVLDENLANFWMNPAYLIPDNAGACVEPGTTPKKTKPIARFNVRSFITSHADGDRVAAGKPLKLRGITFDGGYGVNEVLVSTDGGKTWRETALGRDHGKYSFREWTTTLTPDRAGEIGLKVRASNRIGETQPLDPLWNPAGYMRNVVETVRVNAA